MIDVGELLGAELRGRTRGRKHYPILAEAFDALPAGRVVELDFENVQHVTASWIVGALFPLYQHAAEPRVDAFPVICAVDRELRDDFELVAEQTGQPYVDWCPRTKSNARLIGSLDTAERETLAAVARAGTATGADLAKSDGGVSATGWNNRLREVHRKRLLRRKTEGRRQIYSIVFPELRTDG